MAETNGTTGSEEIHESVKENETLKESETESKKPLEVKPDMNGGGDNAGPPAAKTEKPPVKLLDLSPDVRIKKIKRQIEYYFGDFNLPTDKFLRAAVKEKDGWVPLETLLKFNRLAALTQDPALVVEALQGSELIQINEDKTEIRRSPDKPLPVESEARRKEIMLRTIYAKGFPIENFTIDNALDFFEEYGPTDDVVMRFWQDKAAKVWKFKGSMFIKFPTREAAATFLALEEVKYGDTPLERMWQEDYIELKRKERLEQKMAKRKKPDIQMDQSKKMKKEAEEDKGLPKNATLHMTKCPAELKREMVKEKLEGLGLVVAFIDFNKGDEEGYIRLHEADSAAKVMESCEEGVLKLEEGLEVTLKPLEGEEEATFLETAQQNITARRAKGTRGGGRGGRGRRGGRGGRGGGRGHWNKRKNEDEDDSTDSPKRKVQKTEDSDGGE